MEIRVAAYGRVPSHRDALLRQKAVMIQRFSSIIRQNDDWIYRGAFIDSGAGHDQLDELLGRCREGAIDTIITPSMNTLSLRRDDLYRTLSELKSLGVDITFLDEGLHTDGESGDEFLSTLASFIKPVKPPKPIELPYGIGDEDEAAVVKRVFELFLSGHGRIPIARMLNDEQIPPPRLDNKVDCSDWTYCDIRRILADPVYAEKGLIDNETWSRTLAEASRRNASYGRRPPTDSPLRNTITCGVCGNHYTRRERGRSSLWLCKTYMKKGSSRKVVGFKPSKRQSKIANEGKEILIVSIAVADTLSHLDFVVEALQFACADRKNGMSDKTVQT